MLYMSVLIGCLLGLLLVVLIVGYYVFVKACVRRKELPWMVEEKIKKIMMTIPNIIDPSVPIGKDDSENVEIERFGEPVVPDGPGGGFEERLMLALRLTEGYRGEIPERLREKASSPMLRPFVEIGDDFLRLTREGFLVSNTVIAELL